MDELMQAQLGNAGTWFEESLSFRSLQGEKKLRRNRWKWWQRRLIWQAFRSRWGQLHSWPHKMRPLTHLCSWSVKGDPRIKVASGPCGPSRLSDRSIHTETAFVWFKCHLWCDQHGIKWSGEGLHSCCKANFAAWANIRIIKALLHTPTTTSKNHFSDNTLNLHVSSVLLFWIRVAQRGKTDVFERVRNNSMEICPALPHKKKRGRFQPPESESGRNFTHKFFHRREQRWEPRDAR